MARLKATGERLVAKSASPPYTTQSSLDTSELRPSDNKGHIQCDLATVPVADFKAKRRANRKATVWVYSALQRPGLLHQEYAPNMRHRGALRIRVESMTWINHSPLQGEAHGKST